MLDWAKTFHEAIGIQSPGAFIAVFALLGLVLFGGTAWLIDRGYRLKLREQKVQAAALAVGPASASIQPAVAVPAVPSISLRKGPDADTGPSGHGRATNPSINRPNVDHAMPPQGKGSSMPKTDHQQVHIEQHNEGSSGTNIAAQNLTINQDQPRTLSDKQRADLAYAISKYPSQEFRITAFMSAPDGQSYGADVGTQILRGGWMVPGNAVDRAIATRVDGVRGLAVLVKDKSNPPLKAMQLRNALDYAGLNAPILDGDGIGDDVVVLWIGSK
jgi:hypothetical protein